MCGGEQLKNASADVQEQLGGQRVDEVPCEVVKTVRPVVVVGAPRILRNPDGSTPNPVSVTLRIDADRPEISYSGTATVIRSHARVQLFTGEHVAFGGASLQMQIPLVDLTVSQSLTVRARGVEDGMCRITLALEDPGEAQINVLPPASQDIEVVTINEVTPTLNVGGPTLWYDPSSTKTQLVTLSLSLAQSNPAVPYSGTTTLGRSAARATVHQQANAEDAGVLGGGSSRELDTSGLLGQTVTLYLKAQQAGDVTFTLTLADPGDARIRVLGPATQTLTVREVNRVGPELTVDGQQLLREPDGSPCGEVALHLRVRQTVPEIGYTGTCWLRRSHAHVEVYHEDRAMFGGSDELAINASSFNSDTVVTLAMRGQADGDVQLEFVLDDPNRDDTVVLGPSTATVNVVTINEVTPTLNVGGPTLWYDPSSTKTQLVTLSLSLAQSNPAVPYSGTTTLGRSAARATVHQQANAEDAGVLGGGSSRELDTSGLLGQTVTLYLKAQQAGDVTFTLTLADPGDARIRVLGPATQTLTVREVNRVGPELTVDGQQLLREPDGSPCGEVALHLRVRQTVPEIGYTGTCWLRRSHAHVEVYHEDRAMFGGSDELAINASSFNSDTVVTLAMRGQADGDVQLEFVLDDPNRNDTVVLDPSTATVNVATINEVTPSLVFASPSLWHDPAGTKRHIITATIHIAQSNASIPYQGATSLTRSGLLASIHAQADGSDQDAFSANDALSLATNALLANAATAYVRALGPGDLTLTLALSDPNDPRIRVLGPVTQTIPVRELNVVTPHIDVEYRVVPVTRTLAPHQTSLVRAEVWITQTQAGVGYTGHLRVRRGNGNLRAYSAADGSGGELFGGANHFDVSNNRINTGQHFVFYLAGSTAGAVSLGVEVENVNLPEVREAGPATVAMSVVELTLELHRDAASPAPGAMSTQDKITTGGLVMVQSADGHRGRLRLSIPAPSPDIWSVGAADYEVVVSVEAAHGAIELFGHPTQGAIGAGLGLPVRLRADDFQNGAVDLWIQGRTHTQAWREIKVDIGLDRGPGGLAKAIKRNGDWACVTVFEVTQLTPTAPARQYINLDTDHTNHPEHGRRYRSQATLAPALDNVAVMFKLVAGQHNKANLPPNQRSDDPNTPVRALTNNHGVAQADLLLSRYGGDVFQIGAYLEEDATAGNAHPVVSSALTVWRKIYYVLYCMARTGLGDFSNRIDENGVQTEFQAAFVEIERTGALHALANDRQVVFANFAAWANLRMPGPHPNRTVALGFIDSLLNGPMTDNVQLAGLAGGAIFQSPVSVGRWYDLSLQANWLDGGFAPQIRTAAVAPGAWHPRVIAQAGGGSAGPGQCQLRVDLRAEAGNVDSELTVRVINTITNLPEQQTWSLNNVAAAVHSSAVINGYTIDPANWFVSLNVRTPGAAAGAWQPLPLNHIGVAAVNDDFRLELDLRSLSNANTYDVELRVRSYSSQDFKGAQNGVSTVVALREVERAMVGQEDATARQIVQHEIGHYLGLGSRELFDGSNNNNYYDNPGIGPHCNHGPDTWCDAA